MTSPPEPEPDPFKNARGLNAIFAKKSGPPLWPFMLAAVVLIGVVGLRIELAERQSEAQNANLEIDRILQDHNGSVGAGLAFGATPTSVEAVREKSQKVCSKLGCAGGAAADSIVADCVRQNVALAEDPLSRGMLGEMLDGVLTACGDKSCAEFPNCYFDHLKAMSGALVISSGAPVSDEDRSRLKQLVCDVARETPGRLPDVTSPNASPKARELSALMDKVGPAVAAGVMKDADCGAPLPDTSAKASASANAGPSAR